MIRRLFIALIIFILIESPFYILKPFIKPNDASSIFTTVDSLPVVVTQNIEGPPGAICDYAVSALKGNYKGWPILIYKKETDSYKCAVNEYFYPFSILLNYLIFLLLVFMIEPLINGKIKRTQKNSL